MTIPSDQYIQMNWGQNEAKTKHIHSRQTPFKAHIEIKYLCEDLH